MHKIYSSPNSNHTRAELTGFLFEVIHLISPFEISKVSISARGAVSCKVVNASRFGHGDLLECFSSKSKYTALRFCPLLGFTYFGFDDTFRLCVPCGLNFEFIIRKYNIVFDEPKLLSDVVQSEDIFSILNLI